VDRYTLSIFKTPEMNKDGDYVKYADVSDLQHKNETLTDRLLNANDRTVAITEELIEELVKANKKTKLWRLGFLAQALTIFTAYLIVIIFSA